MGAVKNICPIVCDLLHFGRTKIPAQDVNPQPSVHKIKPWLPRKNPLANSRVSAAFVHILGCQESREAQNVNIDNEGTWTLKTHTLL